MVHWKKVAVLCMVLSLLLTTPVLGSSAGDSDAGADAGGEKKAEVIPYWTEDSPAMASIIDYVKTLTDENSDEFVPEEERVAVFDMDGTVLNTVADLTTSVNYVLGRFGMPGHT
jgi:hypothetical protein